MCWYLGSFHLKILKSPRNVLMPKSQNFDMWAFLILMTDLSLRNRILAGLLVACWVYFSVFCPFNNSYSSPQGANTFWSSSSSTTKEQVFDLKSLNHEGKWDCCSLFSCHNKKISLPSTVTDNFTSANASISHFEKTIDPWIITNL